MIDLSHIPETPGLSVFLPQSVDANSWQTWQKPRGFVMATIYAIGPGGGGGSGRADSASVTRAGGAGGGSGGLSRLTVPLFMLPDTLYIRVTPGGSGGAIATATSDGIAGNAAFAPSSSLVAAYPSTTAQYLFLLANAGGGGGAGIGSVSSSGGIAGTQALTTNCPLSNLGATLFIGGNAGASGRTNTSGDSITQSTASQIYGGAGGGGSTTNASYAGGSISALALTPFLVSTGGAIAGTAGSNGFSWSTIFPMKLYGGAGGAGRFDVAGTNGGNGSVPGAGGGGGGSSSVTSGAGGDGGPGCVIIQCW